MIAKIVQENDIYYSYVFAEIYNGFYSKALVFHSESGQFRLVEMYRQTPSLVRTVFIIDPDRSDFITIQKLKLKCFHTKHEVDGYEWILNDTALLENLINNREIPPEVTARARKLNAGLEISEWNYVKDQKDAEKLLSAAWGFHDAEIDRMEYTQQPNQLTVHFTGCWAAELDLIFEGNVAMHSQYDDAYTSDIYEASVLFENGYIYWVDAEVEKYQDISPEEHQYFRARSLKWRMKTTEAERSEEDNPAQV